MADSGYDLMGSNPVHVRDKDRVGRMKVSCDTLRALMAESYRRENGRKFAGENLKAGIATYVRVPVCDCGLCAAYLAECRRSDRKLLNRSYVTPVMSCKTAVRLLDVAAKAGESEEDRLRDIVEEAVVVHQCKDPAICRIGSTAATNAHVMAERAAGYYREFVLHKPYTKARIGTHSGSLYELFYRNGSAFVTRYGSDAQVTEEPLSWVLRMGDRLMVNDWHTSQVISASIEIVTTYRDRPAMPDDPYRLDVELVI